MKVFIRERTTDSFLEETHRAIVCDILCRIHGGQNTATFARKKESEDERSYFRDVRCSDYYVCSAWLGATRVGSLRVIVDPCTPDGF